MFKQMMLPIALLSCVVMSGCNGPTKSGLEARENARGRVDDFNAQLTYDQAFQAFEVGQLDRAENTVIKAIQQYPSRHAFQVLHGRILIERHELERALQAFGVALDAMPNDPEAHYYSGIIFQRWSQDERAFDHYMKAFEGDHNEVQYLLAAAESLVAVDRTEEARMLIEPNMAHFEHNAALRHLLAHIAQLEGRSQDAVDLLREARIMRPDDLMLLEELARAEFQAALYGDCLTSLEVLKLQSSDAVRDDLTHLKAQCLAYLDRGLEARDIYSRLTQSSPSNANLWIEYGSLAWGMGDWRRVAESSVRIIALAPSRYEGYMLKGMNERQKGNLEDAAHLFKQASERTSVAAMPHVLLGLTLTELGQKTGARQAFRNALAVEPGHGEATRLLQQLERDALTSVPGSETH